MQAAGGAINLESAARGLQSSLVTKLEVHQVQQTDSFSQPVSGGLLVLESGEKFSKKLNLEEKLQMRMLEDPD